VADGLTPPFRVRLTLRRSLIGRPEGQRRVVRALGLRRMGAVREHPRTAAVLGAIRKVAHLVRVDEVSHGRDR
jgi:large subunit ribosomal protein L30